MKFKDYVEFKDLKIGLVKEKKSNYDELVRKIEEDYNLGSELTDLKKILNSELSCMYQGRFKFDFCLQEDININKLKVRMDNRKKFLKEKWLKSLDRLSKSKTKLERIISETDE